MREAGATGLRPRTLTLMVAFATAAASATPATALPPGLEDLTLGRPFSCFVPDIQSDQFDVPLEEHSPTPSANFVDGNEFTFVYSPYNFDCYATLAAESEFTSIRISWKEGAFAPAVLSTDCRHYGVGSWRLFASSDGKDWALVAGKDGFLITAEDLTPLFGMGKYLRVEVRMAQCPPIGGYTFSVFGRAPA